MISGVPTSVSNTFFNHLALTAGDPLYFAKNEEMKGEELNRKNWQGVPELAGPGDHWSHAEGNKNDQIKFSKGSFILRRPQNLKKCSTYF